MLADAPNALSIPIPRSEDAAMTDSTFRLRAAGHVLQRLACAAALAIAVVACSDSSGPDDDLYKLANHQR